MLKLVLLVCAIGGPCEYQWWSEPFRTDSGCHVAGFVAAHDWLRAHPGYVLRRRSCERATTAAAAAVPAGEPPQRSGLINR